MQGMRAGQRPAPRATKSGKQPATLRAWGETPATNSRTELERPRPVSLILHDCDSLHDSRQRKGWRRHRCLPVETI